MEEILCKTDTDTIHPHCRTCIKINRCFLKPIPHDSCEIMMCKLKCGFRFHACKAEEHSLLCPNEKVPCINVAYGCPAKLIRCQQAKHLETCPASVVVCTMEWNRWPLSAREREMGLSQKMEPPVASQLDVALALRDQRMLNEWLKTPRENNNDKDEENQSNPIPVVSVTAGAEYLCIETADTVILHAGFDDEFELPEGGEYTFYFVAGDASCGASSAIEYNDGPILDEGKRLVDTIDDECKEVERECEEINELILNDKDADDEGEGAEGYDLECAKETDELESNIQTISIENSKYNLILQYESVPMITEQWGDGNEYNVIACDMELDELNVSNPVQFLDNHHVSDIFSASMEDHVAPADPPVEVEVQAAPANAPVNLGLKVENRARSHKKSDDMYTFICAQEFRRDQYSMHYKNVHSDIHGGLNGWLEHRCPLAPYGCTYTMTRLYPSTKGARVVHSDVLESFGVKPSMKCDNSNNKQNFTSGTFKNGFHGYFDDCNMDIDAPKRRFGLSHLPCEILRHIFRFLDPFSLCNVALTCHYFRSICATLLRERGMVVQRWYKRDDGWAVAYKTWMFSTSFTPVVSWGFEELGHMSNHMKECPYFERNVCPKPFFHLLNEEPSSEIRTKLEAMVEEEIH